MAYKETRKEILGLSRITKKRIRELCRKDKLYQTPELNDVLYLHYQGFECIECLDEYTELKCLWLECNAISEIQGLDKQTKLKCLFLHSNLIRKIENLEYCKELDTLNLSQNHIRKIENCGFEVLPVLNTLNLASNYLKDFDSLKELENCKNLSVLDLSNNRIDDILVVKIFSLMPELKVLVLQGNPVVSKIPQYRKTLTLECKNLTYLDSRPVFPKDRACAEAWKRGGYAEERKENERWNRRERKKIKDGVNATIHLRNKYRKPEDQIALISSSDSEDDAEPQKRNIKIHLVSDLGIDSMWDEVSGDIQENKCISSINENEGSGDTMIECIENQETNDNIVNDGETNGVVKEQEIENSHCMLEVNEDELELKKEYEVEEDPFLYTFNEDYQKSEHLQVENEQTEQEVYSSGTDNENFNELQSNELENFAAYKDATVIEQTESEYEENYASTIEAIRQITESLDLPGNSNKYTEKHLGTNEENDQENYEPLKELEEKMNELLKESESKNKFYRFKKIEEKSLQKLENERQSFEVNRQLKTDFEELFTNMSNFLSTLEKEQEEREEVKKALFCTEKAAKLSSRETTDNEDDENVFKSRTDSLIDAWDNATKLKAKDEQEPVEERNELINAKEQLTNEVETYKYLELEDDDIKSCTNLDYDANDISLLTRRSNEALIALEKSSENLKILLQKLENRNEELFKNFYPKEKKENEGCDKRFETSFKTSGAHGTFNNAEDDLEEVKYIAIELVEEILQSLESIYSKPKSYEIPLEDLDGDADFNFATLERQPEECSKSIPQVIESFNQLFRKLEAEQRKRPSDPLENLNEQKSLILKELSLKPNLKHFNNDTRESLDAQLEEIRKNQRKKVKRIIDRVYAQKDRYNDTIELVDGKLMVLNHETQELKALPKPMQYEASDSESSYDTALSDDDETGKEELGYYKYLRHKSSRKSMHRVLSALSDNKGLGSNDESDESSDEFYSLEAQNKPNLYAIDKELIKNLNFDFSNLTPPDENHIVRCARSYEELKHCITLDREKEEFTEQENKLLENITETKNKTLQGNKEEQLWFNKSFTLKDQTTSETQLPCEKIVANKSLREFLNETYNTTDSLREVESSETFGTTEQHSEEEKNEIENNFDIENEIAFAKSFDFKDGDEISIDNSGGSEEKNNEVDNNFGIENETGFSDPFNCNEWGEVYKDNTESNDENKNQPTFTKTPENSANEEIIECNLEIVSDTNEEVETITVNAELHF